MSSKTILCIENCEKCDIVSCNFNPRFLDIFYEVMEGVLAREAKEPDRPSINEDLLEAELLGSRRKR